MECRTAKCGIKLWVLCEESFTYGIFRYALGSSLEVFLKNAKA
jgi:hypothetical protein